MNESSLSMFYVKKLKDFKKIRLLSFIGLIIFFIFVIKFRYENMVSIFDSLFGHESVPVDDAEGWARIIMFFTMSTLSVISFTFIIVCCFIPLIIIFCVIFRTMKKYFDNCIEELNYSKAYELLAPEKKELVEKNNKLIINMINSGKIKNIIGLTLVFFLLIIGNALLYFISPIIIIFLYKFNKSTFKKYSSYNDEKMKVLKECFILNSDKIDTENVDSTEIANIMSKISEYEKMINILSFYKIMSIIGSIIILKIILSFNSSLTADIFIIYIFFILFLIIALFVSLGKKQNEYKKKINELKRDNKIIM